MKTHITLDRSEIIESVRAYAMAKGFAPAYSDTSYTFTGGVGDPKISFLVDAPVPEPMKEEKKWYYVYEVNGSVVEVSMHESYKAAFDHATSLKARFPEKVFIISHDKPQFTENRSYYVYKLVDGKADRSYSYGKYTNRDDARTARDNLNTILAPNVYTLSLAEPDQTPQPKFRVFTETKKGSGSTDFSCCLGVYDKIENARSSNIPRSETPRMAVLCY